MCMCMCMFGCMCVCVRTPRQQYTHRKSVNCPDINLGVVSVGRQSRDERKYPLVDNTDRPMVQTRYNADRETWRSTSRLGCHRATGGRGGLSSLTAGTRLWPPGVSPWPTTRRLPSTTSVFTMSHLHNDEESGSARRSVACHHLGTNKYLTGLF